MTDRFLADAAERVIATAALAFAGALVIALQAGQRIDKAALTSAAVAALAAALDVVKVLIARRFGDPESAGFLD